MELHTKRYQRFHSQETPFAQVGTISDLNIGQLREGIKNAMIPLLIKVFELKLAAQQAKTPPSRLQKQPEESLDKIREQLELLAKDLNLLHLWCESAQKQVSKAQGEIEELSSTDFCMTEESGDQKLTHLMNRTLASQNVVNEESEAPAPEKKDSNWLRNLFPW